MLVGVGQTKTVGKERRVFIVNGTRWRRVSDGGPRKTQLAAKVILNVALGSAQQHIGNARPFGARQPGGNKSIGGVEIRIHPQGSAGQKYRYHRNAFRLYRSQQFKIFAGNVRQMSDIALDLGVAVFAKHHDGHVWKEFIEHQSGRVVDDMYLNPYASSGRYLGAALYTGGRRTD